MGTGVRSVLASILGVLIWCGAGIAGCAPGVAEIRTTEGVQRISVELAADEASRSRGLMHRRQLAEDSGMLFLFEQSREVAFWMRNTLIPLDMIFIAESGRVVKVHANAVPHDDTAISSGTPVRAVLEIPGGRAAQLGIVSGVVLRHVAMPQIGAHWPCDEEALAPSERDR